MENYLIGAAINAAWVLAALYVVFRRMDHRHRLQVAEFDAVVRAEREDWNRKQISWTEEDRKWAEAQAAHEKFWAESEAEIARLQAGVAELEGRSAS